MLKLIPEIRFVISLKSVLASVAIVVLFVFIAGHAAGTESPATADSAMIVSAHPAATIAGLEILKAGGNAVDAAVVVAFALAVCEPYASGIGGGGFVVVFDQEDKSVRTLDCRETAPASAHKDLFLIDGQANSDMSCYGPTSVAVPGLVRGLWELHNDGGSLPWSQLLSPAISLATDGFPVTEMLRERIENKAERFNNSARLIFMPDDQLPTVGDLLVQEDLGKTLKKIAEQGPDAFYTGSIARAIAQTSFSNTGGITEADLTGYNVKWREPIYGTYRGLDVYSMAPPSSGGIHLVQMLNILEKFDLASAGFGSAKVCHLLAESMKFAYADRSRFLGDTDFVEVPVARLISKLHAVGQQKRISPQRAVPENEIEGAELLGEESPETTHFSIVDAQGNAVAATLTINLTFGSCLVAEGTGVLLNDEMDDFVAAPGKTNAFGLVGGKANAVEAGKRPISSMTPTIVLNDGRVFIVTGAPGGSKIISTTLQTIVNVVDFEMDVLQAVSAPRIHHQWYPRTLFFEPFGLSPDTIVMLEKMGHKLTQRSPMCNAQVIVVDRQTGKITGGSDPRGIGLAAGF